ncbi:hypothetical protein CDD81_5420 [Ophiocordyceps australis]|uniref:Uncharacterized protein n=1 Tax=Ophiocordyceps australis TaxID=1399860 RepID=A0A2C5Y8B5_9HYPO|nr:hypothetical protein CDD81_5420 [Ophiocordyceps australis]
MRAGTAGMQLRAISSSIENKTYSNISNFYPIPELQRLDGDLDLFFLSGNGVLFTTPSSDPWYQATELSTTEKQLPNGHGDTVNRMESYRPKHAASPMACFKQAQLCNAVGQCGPLASWTEAASGAAPLFSFSDEVNGTRYPWESWATHAAYDPKAARWAWFAMILDDSYRAFPDAVEFLGFWALSSRKRYHRGEISLLEQDQWKVDMASIWNVMLSSFQASFVIGASGRQTGLNVRELFDSYRPQESFIQDICNNQMILSSDYTSFSVFFLILTYMIGLLLVVTSYAMEPLYHLLWRRRGYKEHKFLEWATNETLQLQRVAYQGIGSGAWRGFTEAIPTTEQNTNLANLVLFHGTERDKDLVLARRSTNSSLATEHSSILTFVSHEMVSPIDEREGETELCASV